MGINLNFFATGRVVTDPEEHVFPDGVRKVSFRFVVNERKRDRRTGEWSDGNSSFYTVHCYRNLAENVLQSFAKGDPVFVCGKQRIRNWEKEDRRGISVEIEANTLGHDLRYGTTEYEKKHRATTEVIDLSNGTQELDTPFGTVVIEDISEIPEKGLVAA